MRDSSDGQQSDGRRLDDSTTPRLGIRHLILWIFATAIVLSAHSTIRILMDEPVHRGTYLAELVGGTACGAGLAGIIVGLWRWRKGKPVVVHPGYVFLYLGGIGLVLDLGLTIILSLLARAHDHAPTWYFTHRHFVGYGLMSVAVVVALVRTRRTPLWCLPVMALLLLTLSQAIGSLPYLVEAWSPILTRYTWLTPYNTFLPIVAVGTATVLVVAVVDAYRSDEKRDWVHWLGVAVVVGMAAPHLIEAALPWL